MGDAVFALGMTAVVHATGCASLIGIEDWSAGSGGATPFDVHRVQVVLAAGATAVANPGAVRFDNLNLRP